MRLLSDNLTDTSARFRCVLGLSEYNNDLVPVPTLALFGG
jgi:hypothetical protein